MTDNEWVLVPRTVTAEMEAVYANDTGAYPDAQSLHDAMLAAAPSPPTAVDQSELVRFVRLAADNIEQALALKSVDVLTTLEPGDLRQAADALASLTAKAAAPAPVDGGAQ
ncbi:hypothetical protein [Pseudoxanthomonas winnipegensis]|uniref:Uncharacterized protein n=1 Tax=Pseudoxanthomonas winnipegensis TaxID=2480810 RepID=A0A4Q8L4P7_9GAMM|nr:hypothetical protein [Pseudoxanthomonas winnipegensis]TAA20340.1 hypothetical protein EA660_18295 [Pseudoxanthomonas winnipegensis]